MAPTISPLQALQDLISIMNVEHNKLSSVQQIKKALTRTKEFLPEFEDWETSFGTITTENEALKTGRDKSTSARANQTLVNPTNTYTDSLTKIKRSQKGTR